MGWLERSGIKKDGAVGTELETIAPNNNKATPIIDDERGIPSVNQRNFRSKAMPFSLAALAFAIAGAVWLLPSQPAEIKKVRGDPRASINERFDEGTPTNVLAPARPPAPPAPPASAETAKAAPISVIPAPDAKAAPSGTAGGGAKKELSPFELRQASRVTFGAKTNVANSDHTGGGTQPEGMANAPNPPSRNPEPQPQGAPPEAPPEKPSVLAGALTPTKMKGVSAARIADRTFTIAQGAMVHCNLDTAISSAQPGMTKCTTTRHIYGDDGKVIMLDRGTELTGQYQGALQHGQARIFVLWTRAKTPAGVLIDLASPGTDTLGRSGLDGEIDSHFFERFGSAMLLSIVDDVAGIISSRAQNKGGSGNTVLYPSSTASTSKDAAAIAVENSIKIPPTLNKNQGEHVSVFVARDLDFRSVYSLQVANDSDYSQRGSAYSQRGGR